ncbi:twin-arginine translocase subunit TatC [Sulfolobus islandicus]|uniref:Sec-independent protein translocase protein TatC n=1 Tax=Saccharolobus islandicus (strain HVE10/4) TaxID=930943 RepID=F0NKI2_SACI0|nr:twin-arginine translocase subunit TatC [Sulfolobus islandicus]ADX82944.1 Sec-independent protein translocase, TatC subunit [Sulfolobus islandicus HVE10/4]WCM38264.1 twin-arginine translocase subunit TatC [Sulfolobus islandicus]
MTERTREVEKLEERPLIEHLRELAYRLRRILIALAITFMIYFTLGLELVRVYLPYPFFGLKYVLAEVPVLYPSLFDSISVQLTQLFIYNELPKGVKLIIINLFDPLFASFYISLYLAIFTTIPIIVREIWAFVAPGLYEHEKKLFKSIIFPAFLLFALGSAFAYFLLIPLMLRIILLYATTLGSAVEPTLGLRSFVSTVMTLLIATGLSFELPLIMGGLTGVGVVKSITWLKNWRWGVLVSFIIAWIISPGTTGGIIETVIGITLSTLYFIGALISKFMEKGRKKESQKTLERI